MKVIAIAGEPATGKSTLMIELIKSMNSIEHKIEDIPVQILWRKDPRRGNTNDVCVLGIYEPGETFGGTDRLSMSIQPKVIQAFPKFETTFKYVLFEGDRLFNAKFLEFIFERYPMKVFLLETPEDVKNMRHSVRDNQDKKWLAGRVTKIRNIMRYNGAMKNRYNVTVLPSVDEKDMQNNLKVLLEELK